MLRSAMLAALLIPALPLTAAAQDSLDAALEPIRARYGLPALAAAVVSDGRILAKGAVGNRVLGARLPVAADDRFHIGSDTKAMTATLAAMLVDEGKLKWDSTVGEILGPVIPGLKANVAAITLERLLSHTSGLPSDDDEIIALYFGNAYETGLTEFRRKLISDWGTKNEPAQTGDRPFAYSNLGFIIAGAMISEAAGEPWEQLIHKRLFEPLSLESAGLGPQATMGIYDAPVGHDVDDATGKVTPRPWGPSADLPTVLGPAGLAHMSVGDFAVWAGWNAGEGRRGPNLVKPDTLKRLHTGRVEMAIADRKAGVPDKGAYGLGWGLIKFEWTARPVLTHNGSNSLNFATILVDPAIDLGVVSMTNFPGNTADAALLELTELLYRKFMPTPAKAN